MNFLKKHDLDIRPLLELVVNAGSAIMEVYGRTSFAIETKADASPLTEADRVANAILVEGLQQHYSGIPIISEETRNALWEERKHWSRCWLVDPLDGTKEFVKRNGEFTVNVALIEDGEPVLGVVYQPAADLLYWGDENGAFRQTGRAANEIHSPERIHGGPHYSEVKKPIVVASRSHLTLETMEFVERLRAGGGEPEFLSAGSSLKFCLVAEGRAQVYPRYGPTMEWDTAAAHAVTLAAGRKVIQAGNGEPLHYNKEDLLNPWFIVE